MVDYISQSSIRCYFASIYTYDPLNSSNPTITSSHSRTAISNHQQNLYRNKSLFSQLLKSQKMAEKEPSNIAQQKSDVESTTIYSEELRPKKSMKCLAYVAAFAVFLTVIIILFSLTIMRVRDPKHRLSSIGVEGITFNSSTASPSFSMRFDAAVAVKNTNFGQFKFDNSTIKLAYKGTNVGEAIIAKAQARARSTKRIEVLVGVSSNNVSSNSALASDINTGILTLTSHVRLDGKVHLLKIFKTKKSPEMNCTININLVDKVIQDWHCN